MHPIHDKVHGCAIVKKVMNLHYRAWAFQHVTSCGHMATIGHMKCQHLHCRQRAVAHAAQQHGFIAGFFHCTGPICTHLAKTDNQNQDLLQPEMSKAPWRPKLRLVDIGCKRRQSR